MTSPDCKPTWWQRITLRRATSVVEGSASMQLVCPHCGETQTNSIVDFFPDAVHVCRNTYSKRACGRSFIGPGPTR